MSLLNHDISLFEQRILIFTNLAGFGSRTGTTILTERKTDVTEN